jgi:ribosomal protein L11 methyltransferase
VKIDLMKLKNDELCGEYGTGVDFGRMYAESVPLSDDWKHRWKEGFKPFRVTERFIVCPPWDIPYDASCLSDEVRDGDRDGKIIIIDPGMAFGTGSHETTSMCVRALEDTVRPGVAVLDIGTGSGILSVVAVLLGAERVSAVEIDADAVRAARLNFERNGVADRIELTEGDIRNIPISECDAETQEDAGRYDAVVANLTSGLIRMILPAVALYMKKSGRLILSGLLDREESAMRQALSAAGFSVERVAAKGEWLMMIASRSGEAACGTEQGCGDSVSPEIPPTA